MNFHNWLLLPWVSPFFFESMEIMFSVYFVYFVLLYFKPAKVNFIQGHIATTLVSVNEADDARDKPAAAMEDGLSENENDSNFVDDSSSTEDNTIRATVSKDGESEEGDGDSGCESENIDNDLAPESIFIKQNGGRVTTNYNRIRFI